MLLQKRLFPLPSCFSVISEFLILNFLKEVGSSLVPGRGSDVHGVKRVSESYTGEKLKTSFLGVLDASIDDLACETEGYSLLFKALTLAH